MMNRWHDEICRVAYELYEKRGREDGLHLDDWAEAEKIVMARHAKETEEAAKSVKKVRRKATAGAARGTESADDGKAAPKKKATARKTGTTRKTL